MNEISVPTKGRAFLRNGFSKITALNVYCYQNSVDIQVQNSRGITTSGYMQVEAAAFAQMCRLFLEQNPHLIQEEV